MSAMTPRTLPAALLLIAVALFQCDRTPAEPPPEVLGRFAADAEAFCKAIVDCIKEDVNERMADNPGRRDMIVNRMDRDLCRDGQKRLLGRLSVDPAGKDAGFREQQYAAYGACTRAVVAAEDCPARREVHRSHPDCVRLREFQ